MYEVYYSKKSLRKNIVAKNKYTIVKPINNLFTLFCLLICSIQKLKPVI